MAPFPSSIVGPGAPYKLLFDDDQTEGVGLSAAFQQVYGSDWRLPPPPHDRPYTFTNFVVSHDGRTSFDLPGHKGGGDISRHSKHDTWLMGLIRARADAVLTGATTLRDSPGHAWTPASIFPDDAKGFATLRAAEGRRPQPIFVLLTRSGDVPADSTAFAVSGQQVVIATTARGEQTARGRLGERSDVAYVVSSGEQIDFGLLLRELRQTYNAATLLSEAGARIYGLLLQQHLIDEEFLTRSPIFVGNPAPPEPPRTGLIEQTAFAPTAPPHVSLVSLRRHGDFLFQRARLQTKG